MRAPPIPKWMLPHAIDYEAFDGTDDYTNPSFTEPVTIEHVRVDETTVFSRDGVQTKVVANAVISVDAVNSTPFPQFIEQSRIMFKEREMIIQKVVPCYQLSTDEIHHYELEVI